MNVAIFYSGTYGSTAEYSNWIGQAHRAARAQHRRSGGDPAACDLLVLGSSLIVFRQRAANAGLRNLYAMEGFLHRMPLPASSADVLVTSRAIGWQRADELAEVERVVRPGGWAVHCIGSQADGARSDLGETLESWGHTPSRYRDRGGSRRRYGRQIN